MDDWTSPRRIAHLDMDAFYASVELLRRPELRGQPVAIGGRGDPTRRGVVTTATYEARAFGVHSGMALSRAAQLCPQLIFLPVDFARYREVSREFKSALARIAPAIEDRGVDEVYIDLTEVPGPTRDLALRLQSTVQQATGLGCSIGIGPNKLIAKIASDLEKPRGITLVPAESVRERLWPLPARKIPGIGPKADARLQAIGVTTIGELAAASVDWLSGHFTPRYAQWLHRAAHGLDDRPLDLDPEPRSRSRETTFQNDLHPVRDWQALARTLAALSRQVSDDLLRCGYRGRTVGIKLRFADFKTVTRDRTVELPLADSTAIRKVVFECLARVELRRPIRLVGVRVGELSPANESEPSPAPHGRDGDAEAPAPGQLSDVRPSRSPVKPASRSSRRQARAADAVLPLFDFDDDPP